MILTLRTRLLIGTIASGTLIYIAAAAVLYLTIRHDLLAECDATLLARAQAVATLVEQGAQGIRTDTDALDLPDYHPGHHAIYVTLWDQQGRTLYRSPSAATLTWNIPTLPDASPSFHWIATSLFTGRQVTLRFTPRTEEDDHQNPLTQQAVLLLATDTQKLNATLFQLATLLLMVFLGAILATSAVLVIIVRRELHCLTLLAAQIQDLGRDGFGDAGWSKRIALRHLPAELTPVVDRLNTLLASLEAALTRERAFTADVAHELRTPLAGLSSALDVTMGRPRQPEEYQRVLSQCRAVTRSMSGMIENLLMLARWDSGQIAVHRVSIELASLLDECWADFHERAARKNLHVTHPQVQVTVHSDPQQLRMVFANLLDNAITYANHGGRIQFRIQLLSDQCVLSIANTGSTLATSDVPRVCDRFWRGDAARTTTGLHCGLGLSIVRQAIHALGHKLEIDLENPDWFRVQLIFQQNLQSPIPPPAPTKSLTS